MEGLNSFQIISVQLYRFLKKLEIMKELIQIFLDIFISKKLFHF